MNFLNWSFKLHAIQCDLVIFSFLSFLGDCKIVNDYQQKLSIQKYSQYIGIHIETSLSCQLFYFFPVAKMTLRKKVYNSWKPGQKDRATQYKYLYYHLCIYKGLKTLHPFPYGQKQPKTEMVIGEFGSDSTKLEGKFLFEYSADNCIMMDIKESYY